MSQGKCRSRRRQGGLREGRASACSPQRARAYVEPHDLLGSPGRDVGVVVVAECNAHGPEPESSSSRPPEHLGGVTYVYCPTPEVPWYRATVLSNYEASLAGAGRWSVLFEVATPRNVVVDPARVAREVVASLPATGIDAAPVTVTPIAIERGYPVPVLGRDAVLRVVDEHPLARGVRSRGRFGGRRDESCDQDYAFAQGVQAVDAAVGGGSEEDVYWHPERF